MSANLYRLAVLGFTCALAAPASVAPAGTSRVTTLPRADHGIISMVTPGKMIAPPPIHTS
jgi:hypothetical protein